jgi:hypothetical protein
MARKKYEFRPDPTRFDWVGKLLLTRKQRKSLLKWLLYSLVCVAGLVLQDSMLAGLRVFGGGFDLAPALVVLICVLEGCENGSVFALSAALIYAFSGSAQGPYVVPLITVIAIIAVIFRQACLRKGFFSILLSTGLGMMCYEMVLFGIGLFLKHTVSHWAMATVMTALLSLVAVPVGYPIARAIGKIGGETWKE